MPRSVLSWSTDQYRIVAFIAAAVVSGLAANHGYFIAARIQGVPQGMHRRAQE
jgi:hypothetical protein